MRAPKVWTVWQFGGRLVAVFYSEEHAIRFRNRYNALSRLDTQVFVLRGTPMLELA